MVEQNGKTYNDILFHLKEEEEEQSSKSLTTTSICEWMYWVNRVARVWVIVAAAAAVSAGGCLMDAISQLFSNIFRNTLQQMYML